MHQWIRWKSYAKPGFSARRRGQPSGMQLETGTHPGEFLALAGPWVARDPVRHNVLATVSAGAVAAGAPLRWAVAREEDTLLGAAICTPPRAILLTSMAAPVAAALARVLAEVEFSTFGVTGPPDEVEAFAEAWFSATGRPVAGRESLGLYRADSVEPPDGVAGALRTADEADVSLLAGWVEAFVSELGHVERAPDPEALLRTRMAGGRVRLWVDGDRPVAMASTSPPVDRVSRVSLVYTPPADRRRGYASAVTAAVTSAELASGARACMLYTERSNSTANAVYRRIGYVDLGDHLELAFAA